MPGHTHANMITFTTQSAKLKNNLSFIVRISRSFCSFCVATPTKSYTLSCKTSYVFDLCD